MCQKTPRNRFLFQLLSRVDIFEKKVDVAQEKKMADKFTFQAIFDPGTLGPVDFFENGNFKTYT